MVWGAEPTTGRPPVCPDSPPDCPQGRPGSLRVIRTAAATDTAVLLVPEKVSVSRAPPSRRQRSGARQPSLDPALGFPAGRCSVDAEFPSHRRAEIFPWEKAGSAGPGTEGAAAPRGTCKFLRVQSKGLVGETREALRQAAVFGDAPGSGI